MGWSDDGKSRESTHQQPELGVELGVLVLGEENDARVGVHLGVEGGGTGSFSTTVEHVQAVLAHSLYALAWLFPPKPSSHLPNPNPNPHLHLRPAERQRRSHAEHHVRCGLDVLAGPRLPVQLRAALELRHGHDVRPELDVHVAGREAVQREPRDAEDGALGLLRRLGLRTVQRRRLLLRKERSACAAAGVS